MRKLVCVMTDEVMSDGHCAIPVMVIRRCPSHECGVKGRWRSYLARTLLHIAASASAISFVAIGKDVRESRLLAVETASEWSRVETDCPTSSAQTKCY